MIARSIIRAIVLALVVAITARVVVWLVEPLLPSLGVIAFLAVVAALVLGGPRGRS